MIFRIAFVGWLAWCCCGCSMLPRRFPDETIPAPVALRPNATLEETIQVVNTNSSKVQQLQINNATLTAPRLPSLKTFIVMERPRHFRMTAESFAGQEFDLGSNNERYWIWVSRDERRAVYHGSHDQFYESAVQKILPVLQRGWWKHWASLSSIRPLSMMARSELLQAGYRSDPESRPPRAC